MLLPTSLSGKAEASPFRRSRSGSMQINYTVEKKDDKPLEPKQVMLRLGNDLDKFTVSISLNN